MSQYHHHQQRLRRQRQIELLRLQKLMLHRLIKFHSGVGCCVLRECCVYIWGWDRHSFTLCTSNLSPWQFKFLCWSCWYSFHTRNLNKFVPTFPVMLSSSNWSSLGIVKYDSTTFPFHSDACTKSKNFQKFIQIFGQVKISYHKIVISRRRLMMLWYSTRSIQKQHQN